MKKAWLPILICILLSSSVLAQGKPCKPRRHAKVPGLKNFTYHKARKKLQAAGWQPLQTKSASDSDVSYGNGPEFWRKGYVEIEACAGTGVAACAFLFKDTYGNRLRVTTEGEELPREKSYARVAGVKFLCD